MATQAQAYKLVAFLIVLRPLGNLSLAWGMKHTSPLLAGTALKVLGLAANPFVLTGVALLILSLLIRMVTLSFVDLSLVLPLTAFGYIVSTALGRFVLGETVSSIQWLGTVVIFLGVALVTSEQRATNSVPRRTFNK